MEQTEIVLYDRAVTATASREVFRVTCPTGVPFFIIMATPPDNLLVCSRSFRKTKKPLRNRLLADPRFVSCRQNTTGEKLCVISWMSPKL